MKKYATNIERKENQSISDYVNELLAHSNTYRGYGGKLRRAYNGRAFHQIVWDLWHTEDKWEKGFDIHHLDENPLNNSPFNLVKLTKSEHMRVHNLCKNVTEEIRTRMGNSKKKPCIVDGLYYDSIKKAVKERNHSHQTIRKRIKEKVDGYFYILKFNNYSSVSI